MNDEQCAYHISRRISIIIVANCRSFSFHRTFKIIIIVAAVSKFLFSIHIVNWSEITPWHLFQPNRVSRPITFMKSNLYFMAMIFLYLLRSLFGTRTDLQSQMRILSETELHLHGDFNGLYFFLEELIPELGMRAITWSTTISFECIYKIWK